MSRGVADFRILPGMRPTTPATDFPAPLSGPHDALIARAKSLELDTPYVPPPGDPLEHHAAGFAKIMCSAVFITGLDPDFAAENVGYFTAPYEERAKLGKPVIDRAARAVHVTLPERRDAHRRVPGRSGVRHAADRQGDAELHARPASKSRLPDAATRRGRWAMRCRRIRCRPELDTAKVKQAVDAAFEPAAAMTAAFVVTWKGRLIAERYGDGHHGARRRSRAGRWARA